MNLNRRVFTLRHAVCAFLVSRPPIVFFPSARSFLKVEPEQSVTDGTPAFFLLLYSHFLD